MARRIKGGIKRRETDLASSSLSVLHSPEHTKRFTELHGEGKREEGNGSYQEEKRGNQKGREKSSQ